MTSLLEQIDEFLDKEIKLYSELLSILAREETALLNADISSLEDTTEEKTTLVQLIVESVQKRNQCFKGQNLISEEGLTAFLVTHGNDAQVSQWLKLRSIAETAQEQNQINGLLIHQSNLRTQSALNVLMGSQNNNTNLYSSTGQKTSHHTSRTIIS